jgi:hypothetical protein
MKRIFVKTPVWAVLLSLILAAPVHAEEFSGYLVGFIYQEDPPDSYAAVVIGEASPLGPFEGINLFTVQGPAIQDIILVITAGGDDLYLVGAGMFTSTQGDFEASLTVVGGTGKFENATGQISGVGQDVGGDTYYYVFGGDLEL